MIVTSAEILEVWRSEVTKHMHPGVHAALHN